MPSVSFRPALALALPLVALAACHKAADNTTAASEPSAASSDWVAANPTESAVPVTLPTTPMTNVPETATPAAQ